MLDVRRQKAVARKSYPLLALNAGAAACAFFTADVAHAQQAQPSPMPMADRWVHVGHGTDRTEEYVDRESIERNGDKVTLWTRSESRPERSIVWKEWEFDCAKKLQSVLAYISDDQGTISHNVARPHREASPILQGSVEEMIYAKVCR